MGQLLRPSRFLIVTMTLVFSAVATKMITSDGVDPFQSFFFDLDQRGVNWAKISFTLIILNLGLCGVETIVDLFQSITSGGIRRDVKPVRIKAEISQEKFNQSIRAVAKGFRRQRNHSDIDDLYVKKAGLLRHWAALGLISSSLFLLLNVRPWFQNIFEAEFLVREAESVQFARIIRGHPDPWLPYTYLGRRQSHFVQSDVSLYAHEVSQEKKRPYIDLAIHPADPSSAKPHRLFAGATLARDGFIYSLKRTRAVGIEKIQIQIDGLKEGESLRSVSVEEQFILPQAVVQVAELEKDVERSGNMVKLSYQEQDQEKIEFWLFGNFPQYDSVKRKNSRYHFRLVGLDRTQEAAIRVVRASPLDQRLLIGLGIGFFCLLLLFWSPQYWIELWWENGMMIGRTEPNQKKSLVALAQKMVDFRLKRKTS